MPNVKIRNGIYKPGGLVGDEFIELDDISIGDGDPNFYKTDLNELKTFIGSAICPPESQIYHVGSNGNDSNSGLCREETLAITNTGIAKAQAQIPSATNRFVIYNPDAHQENTFVLNSPWINLDLPQTRFSSGTNYIYSDTVTKIDEAETFGGAICVVSTGSGVRYFYANKLRGFGIGSNLMLDISQGGTLYGEIKYFAPDSDDDSIRLTDNSTAHIQTDYITRGIEVQTGSTLYLIAKNAENTIFTGGGTLYLNAEKLNGANFTGFTGTVYYFSLDNGGIIKPFLSYDSHPTFTADTQLVDRKYVDDTVGTALIPNQNIYYWGKGGNDSNTGKIWDSERFATLGKAISEAQAQTPSFINQFVLTCNDAGDYDEQRSITSYIHIDAPNATLKSTNSTGHTLDINGSEYSVVKIKEISANSSNAALSCNQDATSYVYLDIDNVRNTGAGVGLETLNGYTLGNIRRCQKFYVGTNSYINSKIDSFTGNGDLIDGSIGSLIIGEHVSGTITKGSASSVSLQVLKSAVLKFGNTILDPIWSYTSHPTFTTDTQLVDKKYVDDSVSGNGSIYHEYYVTGNTAETSIGFLSTPVKVNATTTEGNNNNYFTHSSNRLTYDGTVVKTFHVEVHLSWIMVGSASQELCKLYIYYYDNSAASGGIVGKSTMRGNNDDDGDAPYIVSTQCLIEMDTNDYIEIWISQESGSVRNIIVNDLNVIVNKAD